jgi:hypothetical protein
MKSYVITLACDGQMCNQMMTLAASLANGLEKNANVICPVMNENLKNYFEFKFSQPNEINVVMSHSEPLYIFGKIAGKVANKISSNNRVRIKLPGYIFEFYLDWISMKDDIIFANHQAEIREYFKIKPEIEEKCCKKIAKIRCDNKLLVGVHIRRGDYKTFHEGVWYYSNADYLRWMKDLSSKNSKARFVLFSNEPIDVCEFTNNGIDAVRLSGNAVEDLCCLSMCDYIMGPPSTYSWWASMYGDKKRLILESRTENYSWDDFMYLIERAHLGIDKY